MTKIKELEDLAFSSPAISDLPKSFTGKITDLEIRKDSREMECLYVDICLEDETSFTEKYSALHLAELVKRMKEVKMDDTADLKGVWYEWETVPFSIGFPRHFPKLGKIVGEK